VGGGRGHRGIWSKKFPGASPPGTPFRGKFPASPGFGGAGEIWGGGGGGGGRHRGMLTRPPERYHCVCVCVCVCQSTINNNQQLTTINN
jgi:hypothetical protein